jgi:large repetitive protein
MTYTDENCGAGDGTATVSASGGSGTYSYTWSTTPPQTGQTATGLGSGMYYVTVSDGACTAVDSVTINSIGGPSLTISGNDAACGLQNGSATVTAVGGSGSYTYSWNTTPPQNTPIATGLGAGTYTVTVDDGGPCPSSISVTIGNIPGPSLSLVTMTPETNGMSNGSATVSAAGGTPPYNYTWSTTPPQSGPTASGLPSGVYTVTVEDDYGCTATLNVTVTSVGGATLTLQASPEHCGLCDGAAQVIVNSPVGPYTVVWSNGETTEAITDLCSGTYTVTVTDDENTYIQGVFVPHIAGPTAAFTASPNPATIGEEMVFFMNQSTGATTYLWTFGDGQSSNSENPLHSYGSIDNYTVWLYAFDSFGCVDSISASIVVQDVFTLYIPNAFSPNGDGVNDTFMAFGLGVDAEDYSLRVFDRWGKLVFHTTSINVSWDGSIDGVKREELRTTVYTYVIDFKDRKGLPHQRRGFVTAVY